MPSTLRKFAWSCFGYNAHKAPKPFPATCLAAAQKDMKKASNVCASEQEQTKWQQKDAEIESVFEIDLDEPNDLQGELSEVLEDMDGRAAPKKLFTAKWRKEDKVVGVMVTIYQGSSYDKNFREIEATTVPGERVSTWSMACCDAGKLHDYLQGTQLPPADASNATSLAWAELLQDICSVPADSVTFNWECCAECGDNGFPSSTVVTRARYGSLGRTRQRRLFARGASPTMLLMGLAVRRGFTVMCSDFSLKALIAEWSEEQLGPNPFIKLSQECDERFQLDFVPSDLRNDEVPQQLQVVGELCAAEGKATIGALGGTIMYTVNPTRTPTDLYVLRVLTVVGNAALHNAGATNECVDIPEAIKCRVGPDAAEKTGAAGHVTLTYASGGQLVTSMGHWEELSRLDISQDAVRQVAETHYGVEERQQYESEMNSYVTDCEKMECAQRWSKQMVQKSVPTRMKARTKWTP